MEKWKKCQRCKNGKNRRLCKVCLNGDLFEEKAKNNYEKIKLMSVEEMTKFIMSVKCNTYMSDCGYPTCQSMNGNYCVGIKQRTDKDILEWLQSESRG